MRPSPPDTGRRARRFEVLGRSETGSHVPPALAFRFIRGAEARGDTFNLASVGSSNVIL